jgi:acyl carrier protein
VNAAAEVGVTSNRSEHIEETIKEILISELELDAHILEANGASTPLLGRGIGLDSIDALTLVAAIEKRFDIEVADADLEIDLFRSIRTLADYIARRLSEAPPRRR